MSPLVQHEPQAKSAHTGFDQQPDPRPTPKQPLPRGLQMPKASKPQDTVEAARVGSTPVGQGGNKGEPSFASSGSTYVSVR